MGAGLYLHRDVREPLHDRLARGRAAAIQEREILGAADVAAPRLVAVDEHDERVPRLERARVETDAEIRDREPVLAVRGEDVRDLHAAARAKRHAGDIAFLIRGRRREERGRNLGFRLADGEVRHRACGVDVLLDVRRRHAEGGR